QSAPPHPRLHPFPTRRSSDLLDGAQVTGGVHHYTGADGVAGDGGASTAGYHRGPVFDACAHGRHAVLHGLGQNDGRGDTAVVGGDRKSTRLNSSHVSISYAVF